MSVRYVCALGCGSTSYSCGTYRCSVCRLRIRFREDAVLTAREIDAEVDSLTDAKNGEQP